MKCMLLKFNCSNTPDSMEWVFIRLQQSSMMSGSFESCVWGRATPKTCRAEIRAALKNNTARVSYFGCLSPFLILE